MWAEEHDDRAKWRHTSHVIWSTFAAAGAEKIEPTDFDPYRMKVKQPITLQPGDLEALAKGMGLPIVYG